MGMIGHLLTQEIALHRATLTPNAIGEQVKSYALEATFPGRLRPMTGKEAESADRKTLTATHRVYCGARDIRQTDRMIIGGRTYEVRFVSDPMSAGEFLQVDCELII